jgi:hypothetical protein
VLVQAPHLLALARLAPGTRDVDPAEVHLRAAFAEGDLDRPPAEEVERAGMVPSRVGVVAEWTVESRSPWR